jgi:hypothetical protein
LSGQDDSPTDLLADNDGNNNGSADNQVQVEVQGLTPFVSGLTDEQGNEDSHRVDANDMDDGSDADGFDDDGDGDGFDDDVDFQLCYPTVAIEELQAWFDRWHQQRVV